MTKEPPSLEDPLTGTLTGTMADIASHIGVEATYRFVLEFGGQRLWMSGKSISASVTIYMGEENTQKLICAYKGDYLDVPVANRTIARWLALQGWKTRTIARRLRVKEASVRNWLSNKKPSYKKRND